MFRIVDGIDKQNRIVELFIVELASANVLERLTPGQLGIDGKDISYKAVEARDENAANFLWQTLSHQWSARMSIIAPSPFQKAESSEQTDEAKELDKWLFV